MKKFSNKCQTVIVLSILLITCQASVPAVGQSMFRRSAAAYEQRINEGAKSWLKANYGRAMDWFSKAEDQLTENLPSPTQAFEWRWYRALQTYSVLLTRLVEVDLYQSQSDTSQVLAAKKQAYDWARKLAGQIKDWKEFHASEADAAVRERWIRRFRQAMEKAAQYADDTVKPQ